MTGQEGAELPAAVRTLLSERVHSLEELQLLLVLAQDGEKHWSLSELASATQMGATLPEPALTQLVQHRLAALLPGTPARWAYAPESPALAAAVAQLSAAYARARAPVLVQISQNALTRVRKRAVLLFAEALFSGTKRES